MNDLLQKANKLLDVGIQHIDTIETWLYNHHYEYEAKKKVQPTFIIDCAFHNENIPFSKLDTTPFLKYVEKPNAIFVRFYLHGKTLRTEEFVMVDGDFVVVYSVQSYYNILFITPSSLKTKLVNNTVNLNTTNTSNFRYFINDTVSACIGYSNEASLPDERHMFLECKNNGVFFIINDKESNVVKRFVENNKKDFEIVRAGIVDGNIDIYKSRKLISEFVLFMFIDDPKKPPKIDVEEFEKPPLARDVEEPKTESKKPEPKKPEEPKLEVPKKSEELSFKENYRENLMKLQKNFWKLMLQRC